jgi:hypothetical protein
MNIMVRKGYLKRSRRGTAGAGSAIGAGGAGGAGGHVYRPAAGRERTIGKMLRDLVNRAFNGSAAAAALHLIGTSDLSDGELAELRTLVARKMKEE